MGYLKSAKTRAMIDYVDDVARNCKCGRCVFCKELYELDGSYATFLEVDASCDDGISYFDCGGCDADVSISKLILEKNALCGEVLLPIKDDLQSNEVIDAWFESEVDGFEFELGLREFVGGLSDAVVCALVLLFVYSFMPKEIGSGQDSFKKV